LHHQFQGASTIQKERPLHQQLDLATGEQRTTSLKKDTAAANVEGFTRAEPRDFTFVPELILNV
jgi:hypothetical protein